MAHGYKFYRVSMDGSFVRRLLFNQVVMYSKMAWKFGRGLYGVFCNNNVTGTII